MKNLLIHKSVLILLAFSVFTCKDKDPVPDPEVETKASSFTYALETYELSKGFLVANGVNADGVSSNYDIILLSSGINYDKVDGYTGTGHRVFLDLNVSGTGAFVPGTFSWSGIRAANKVVSGTFKVDWWVGAANFKTGTVTVAVSGSTYTIDFLMTPENQMTVEGHYSGPLTPM